MIERELKKLALHPNEQVHIDLEELDVNLMVEMWEGKSNADIALKFK